MGPRRKRPSLARGRLTRKSLRDRPLVELLIEALDDAATGSLELTDPDGGEHIVCFVHGLPTGSETRGIPESQRAVPVSQGATRRELVDRMRRLFRLPPDTRHLFHAQRNLLASSESEACDEGDVLRLVGYGARLLWAEGVLEAPKFLPLRLRGDAPIAHLDLDDGEREVVAALLHDALSVEELAACAVAPREAIERMAVMLTLLRFVDQSGEERPPVGASRRPRSGILRREPDIDKT